MLKKWKLLTSNNVFSTRWLSVEKRAYELPNGEVADDYYLLKRADYVLIIAIDNNKRMVLEKQYRHGMDKLVYEIPAGFINKGEDPLVAGIRELKEETGLSGKGKVIGEIYTQPGYMDQRAHVVLVELDGEIYEKKLDGDENIEINMVELEKLRSMIADGLIHDMGLLSAMQVYENSKKSVK